MKKLLQIIKIIFKAGLFITSIMVIFLLLLLSYCSYEMRNSKLFGGVKFDKELWKNPNGVIADFTGSRSSSSMFPSVYGTDIRCKMYNDIVTNHLKLGMKLEEVKDLLGMRKSTSITYCTDEKTKCINYSLGTCYASSLTIYSERLIICFNKKQEVVWFGKGKNRDRVCKQKFYCFGDECECTEITYAEHSIECPFKIDKW